MQFVNTKIRLSYKHFYNTGICLNKVLPKEVSLSFAVTLSALGYDKEVYACFKNYCLEHFCLSEKQRSLVREEEFIEPRTSYIAWKLILSRSKIQDFKEEFSETAKKLFDFLLKVNDFLDEKDNNVPRKLATQYSEHLFLDYYQDNVVAQFIRAQKIFVNSGKLKSYIRNFELNNLIDIRKYVYIIYKLLVRYGNIWYLNQEGLTCTQLDNYWRSSISNIAKETNFADNEIKTVLDSISKTPIEFYEVVKLNSFEETDIDIFKNYPFIRFWDNTVIPINNRLAENLLFTNLFYKIVDSNREHSDDFRRTFGDEFEAYVINFARIIPESGNNDCIIQNEFSYSKNRKAGNNLSPDLMIIYSEKKQVIVFEVKSAQILNAYNKDFSDKEAYEKSVNKTVNKPLLQAGKSIKNIVDTKGATTLFDKTYDFIYVSISMSGFAIPNFKINIEEEGIKEDVSKAFFNMPLETYEIFVRLLTAKQRINGFELLLNYNNYREIMSLKTYLYRMEKELKLDTIFFEKKMFHYQDEYINYISHE